VSPAEDRSEMKCIACPAVLFVPRFCSGIDYLGAEEKMTDSDVIRGLVRIATNYRRGLFCPAELWAQVTRLLAGHDATRLLGELPVELQDELRQTYRDRPWSLQTEPSEDEIKCRVERWCLRTDSSIG
jgi:hypothetical protein